MIQKKNVVHTSRNNQYVWTIYHDGGKRLKRLPTFKFKPKPLPSSSLSDLFKQVYGGALATAIPKYSSLIKKITDDGSLIGNPYSVPIKLPRPDDE